MAVVSPVDGTELAATTTVTFTWEATAGSQSNTSVREVQGISSYVVSFAGRDGVWASATIDNGATKEYATDTLAYGEDYSWHVKAIGANGKTATTTPDATFITTYRLRDLGVEGFAYTLDNDTDFDQYTIGFDSDDLPARFNELTEFQISVKGKVYKFSQNEFDNTQYNVTIDYTSGTPNEPSEDDIRNGWFTKFYDFRVEKNGEAKEYDTFTAAFESVEDSESATIYVGTTDVIQEGTEFLVDAHKNITVRPDDSLEKVVFDGNNSHRFFKVSGIAGYESNATLTLIDIVLQNGSEDSGGAVYVSYSDLILEGCELKDNTASIRGGAVYLVDSFSSRIGNSTLTSNQSVKYGGAVYGWHSGVEISDSFFASNTSENGGALNFANGSDSEFLKILRTEFAFNTSSDMGGAIYCFTTLEMDNCTVTANTGANSGGAIYFSYRANAKINNSTITSNESSGNGGAFFLEANAPYDYPSVELNNTVISGNTANFGGGIYLDNSGCVLKTNNVNWSSKPSTSIAFSVDDTGTVHTTAVESDSVQVKNNIATVGFSQMEVH